MSEELFSSYWYRVADLKPALKGHTDFHRHEYRGQRWHVLRDRVTGQYQRFADSAYHVLALMDGKRTVRDIWQQTNTELGDDAPTQDEIIRLLGQLHSTDVLQCDVSPDCEEILRRGKKHDRASRRQRFMNPLAIRIPLFDPDSFLISTQTLARILFSRTMLLVWIALVGSMALMAASHWVELTRNISDRVFSAQNLLVLWFVYPLVKAAHEFGHAWATRVRGGEVHEMGIMMLVMMPVPYVDASSASAFERKSDRMLVGLAGILVELFLAALAMLVWMNVEPGLTRTVAFDVMLIGGVSTLFFNGNPLLRFDGYYVLADWLEIPNLAKKSNKYMGYLARRYLLGVSGLQTPAETSGEARWLSAYAVGSFIYRMVITFAIAMFVAGKYFFAGVVIAIWALVLQLFVPLVRMIRAALTDTKIQKNRTRSMVRASAAAVAVFWVLFILPIPLRIQAQGVVWLPESAEIRAGTDCFVHRFLIDSGSFVQNGTPLIECRDEFLSARVKVAAARLSELEARLAAVDPRDRVEAGVLREELVAARAEQARIAERHSALTVRARIPGRFVAQNPDDMPGRYVKQGQLLGYVLDSRETSARVVIPQSEIGLVGDRMKSVRVRLSHDPAQEIRARVVRRTPAALDRLPGRALGTSGGGDIPVDPSDEEGLRPLQKIFQYQVELPGQPVRYPGERIYAQFRMGSEPLAQQMFRRVRQLFLRRFSV